MQIVSILGGTGSGKGTQCSLLSNALFCAHLSVSDILRAEAANPSSPHANIINENMALGRIGPKEITIGVLQKHINEAAQTGVETFLLDGFPRKLDQAKYFEKLVAPIDLVVVFECPEEVLVQRLSQRKRVDYDLDNVKRRIETFASTTSQGKEMAEEFRML